GGGGECETRQRVAFGGGDWGGNSLVGSLLIFWWGPGVPPIGPAVDTPSVWPSACAAAIAAVPSIRAAPGRLSTTTGLPRACPSRSPYRRTTVSIPVPAASGTMMVTGFDG